MNWKALKFLVIKIAVCLTATTPSRAQEAEAAGVEVTGTAANVIRQDMPVGPYNQPEWTTQGAFGASRVYVRPPGTLSFHFWTPEFKDGEVEHSFREEVEIGLPYRLQRGSVSSLSRHCLARPTIRRTRKYSSLRDSPSASVGLPGQRTQAQPRLHQCSGGREPCFVRRQTGLDPTCN